MKTMNKNTETFDQRSFRLCDQVKNEGYAQSLDGRYTIQADGWVLSVFDGDKLVAYSEMKGDFEASLKEFVEDYLL